MLSPQWTGKFQLSIAPSNTGEARTHDPKAKNFQAAD